ncbi:hypothetical protein PR048_006123 [Dryococelus australis]|uniref:Uncharacterized protein n=1 Tax=Dryococelus australis TaxID=614101 RepID=A0ABQ9IA30_9NEOP|nr:hypothetical protein PR048_006123 [Dryococelus australis]
MNPTKRHRGRKDETKFRRTFSCKYFLKKGTEKIRVYKRVFLNTLSIEEWTDPENKEETQENDEKNFGNLSLDQYDIHQQEKREAREEKESDKVSEECVYTMGLQLLLLCPCSNVSSLYYKIKLAVHNFTIFDLKLHDRYFFLWNETEGGLTANEFSTIICALCDCSCHYQTMQIN